MVTKVSTGQALQTLPGEHTYALSEKLIADSADVSTPGVPGAVVEVLNKRDC